MMRHSKFRHTFGKPLKKDDCYDNIRISTTSWDGQFCAVNPKFLAVVTQASGGGSFLVVPLDKTGRVDREHPQVIGHKNPVLDIKWCPFNDNIIASGSEDTTAKIWYIPDNGLDKNMTDCVADLKAHQKKVGCVEWHPSSSNVLMTCGSDNFIYIWNLETAQPMVEINFPDMIYSASFNWNGSRIVTICKDQMMRVINARTGEVLQEGIAHSGKKPQMCQYLKDGRIFTTGFERMSERMFSIWDENNLKTAIKTEEIDTSNGVLVPYYDPDIDVVYLCGKGDRIIRFYEILDDDVFYLNQYLSNTPTKALGFMPKRGLDINKCEIARFYKCYSTQNFIEVIPMTVPRKSDQYQEDLYPDTRATTPALTPDEWFNGKDKNPVMMSLKELFDPSKQESTESTSNILSLMGGGNKSKSAPSTNSHKPALSSATNNSSSIKTSSAPPPTAAEPEPESQEVNESKPDLPRKPLFNKHSSSADVDVAAMASEMKMLRDNMKKMESRVRVLESRVNELENTNYDIQGDNNEVEEV